MFIIHWLKNSYDSVHVYWYEYYTDGKKLAPEKNTLIFQVKISFNLAEFVYNEARYRIF